MRNPVNVICTTIAVCACLLSVTYTAAVVYAIRTAPKGPFLFTLPIRTQLIPNSQLDWAHPSKLESFTEEFQKAGFKIVGDYQMAGVTGVQLRAFANEEAAVWGEIIQLPGAQTIVPSVATVYTDGTVVEVTSRQESDSDDDHNNKMILHHFEGGPQKLLEELLARRPADKEISKVSIDEFPAVRARIYANEIDALLQRGGPKAEEFKKLAVVVGEDSLSNEQLQKLRALWRREAVEKVNEFVLNEYAKRKGVPKDDLQRADLLVIHDLVDRERAQSLLTDAAQQINAEDADLEALLSRLPEEGIRQAFADWVNQAGARLKIKRLESGTEPLPYDLYSIGSSTGREE